MHCGFVLMPHSTIAFAHFVLMKITFTGCSSWQVHVDVSLTIFDRSLRCVHKYKFPCMPGNPERGHRHQSTSESCFWRVMHARPHTLAEECMHVPTNSHGCTIIWPTSSATSKAHSPFWYFTLCKHIHRHLSQILATHTYCLPLKTFSARKSCLEAWEEGFICSNWTRFMEAAS